MSPDSDRLHPAAALACGCAVLATCWVVIASTPGDAYWINDCGNKALVAQRLLDTGFRDLTFEHPRPALDPEGALFPIPPPFALARGEVFVSAYPPAYPALAAPAAALLGARGLRLPAALGAAAAAGLFALWTAPALGRRLALVGGATLGLATPLFFYGVTVWEHSLTVALTLAAWMQLRSERAAPWAAAGALVGAACWLREELALMALAIVLAGALRRVPPRRLAAFAAGLAAPAGALLAFNAVLYGHPLGGHVVANLGGAAGMGETADRLAALSGLLGGFGHGPAERPVFTWLGIGAPLAGALAPRSLRESHWLLPALAAAGLLAWGIAAVRMLGGDAPLRELTEHNGLLLQWPMVALAGVGAHCVAREPAFRPVRTGALAGLLFAGLVLGSGVLLPTPNGVQVGAGIHWGPRVLLPALPALLLLTLATLRGRGAAARAAWGALASAGLLSTALSVWFLAHQKQDGERFARHLRGFSARVVVTSNRMLAQHVASLWGEKDVLLVSPPASFRGLSPRLQGEPEFLLVARPQARWTVAPPGVRCEPPISHRGRLHYFDFDVRVCRSEPPGGGPPGTSP